MPNADTIMPGGSTGQTVGLFGRDTKSRKGQFTAAGDVR